MKNKSFQHKLILFYVYTLTTNYYINLVYGEKMSNNMYNIKKYRNLMSNRFIGRILNKNQRYTK